MANEQALVDLARGGDREALGRLFERHSDGLEAMVRSRVGEAVRAFTEVDDIVQETFLRARKSLDRFEWQGEASFRSWLFGIANHAILDLAKSAKRRGGDRNGEAFPELASDDPSRATLMRQEEREDRLRDSLGDLSPDHRAVIELVVLEELPIGDVALRIGRSYGATQKLLTRALNKLAEMFGDTESRTLPPPRMD
jgi:RNA polymerase sigma-70 factor (ECF subfamily)